MAPTIPTVKLNTGATIPIFGLGTWKSPPNEVKEAVRMALDAGYNHIDCAWAYQNEDEIGDAIHERIEAGKLKREDIFLTGKVWNTHHSRAKVFESVEQSLKDLRVASLDLFLMHWPTGFKEGPDVFPKDKDGNFIFSDVDYMETWHAMEEIYKKGLVKAIGLANFNREQIERVLKEGTVVPAMLQIESHPYFPQRKMVEYCRSKGIAVTAYSPLGSPDRPFAKPDDPMLLQNPKLAEVAKRHGKSPAQVLIRFQVQRGVVVIPKSTIEREIKENIQIFDFELSEEDMKDLYSLDCGCKFLHHSWLKHHKYFPFAEDMPEFYK